MNPLSIREREIAQRLLAREMSNGTTATSFEEAAKRVLHALQERFVDWFGNEGTRVMLVRAVAVARSRSSHLEHWQVDFENGGIALRALGSGPDTRVLDSESAIVLVGSVLSLTTRLIGSELVDRLITNERKGESKSDLNGRQNPQEEGGAT